MRALWRARGASGSPGGALARTGAGLEQGQQHGELARGLDRVRRVRRHVEQVTRLQWVRLPDRENSHWPKRISIRACCVEVCSVSSWPSAKPKSTSRALGARSRVRLTMPLGGIGFPGPG